jgi:hypothetical protein
MYSKMCINLNSSLSGSSILHKLGPTPPPATASPLAAAPTPPAPVSVSLPSPTRSCRRELAQPLLPSPSLLRSEGIQRDGDRDGGGIDDVEECGGRRRPWREARGEWQKVVPHIPAATWEISPSPLPLPSPMTLSPPLMPSPPSSLSRASHLDDVAGDRSTLPLSSPWCR